MAGREEACTISQPAVAVSATPDAAASAPTRVLGSRLVRPARAGSSPVAATRAADEE